MKLLSLPFNVVETLGESYWCTGIFWKVLLQKKKKRYMVINALKDKITQTQDLAAGYKTAQIT